ncbi:MAG: GatB/YqeY domain-containing protein [Coriobacteriales bacterium]|nr:GatB/YqeY domain-containing protein [Coriobacteriales bacterium]
MDRKLLADEIANAQRAQDKPRLAILRLVKNEVATAEKAEQRELSDAEVLAALKKVHKQTRETLEASIKAGTDEARTALLQQQVDILEGYLPEQVSGAELEAIVERVLAEGGFTEKRDMGRAIGLLVEATGGNADKAEIAKIVGARLG